MSTNLSTLFATAPGLADSFNDIFKRTTDLPAVPPTPAQLPAAQDIHAIDHDEWPSTL